MNLNTAECSVIRLRVQNVGHSVRLGTACSRAATPRLIEGPYWITGDYEHLMPCNGEMDERASRIKRGVGSRNRELLSALIKKQEGAVIYCSCSET